MKSKLIDKYVIGDSIWRHAEGGGTLQYKVVGIRSYDDGPQLEVEGVSCSHGWKCRVLLAQDDYKRIAAVHMLNEDDEDSQRHWHINEGLHFWPTRAEAREEGLRRILSRVKERIQKKEEDLNRERKYLAELEAAIGEHP